MLGKNFSFPNEQKSNLVETLEINLRRKMDADELSFDKAFNYVALDTLGYEVLPDNMSDGRGDFGVDYFITEERTATIFQFKCHDYIENIDQMAQVEPRHLTDLPRIFSLLRDIDNLPDEANAKVRDFLKQIRSSVYRYSLSGKSAEAPYEITIFFCSLSASFTKQAEHEFYNLSNNTEITWDNEKIKVSLLPVLLSDLISEEWRESNVAWRTADGKSSDTIDLHVRGEMISSPNSLVFFSKAFDLVEAFNKFGYQMFEPNVRCELKRSKVNEAIRDSVKHSRGRKEFKHLNNGITLICSGYRKINSSTTVVRVTQPGVINGLQTVKSIHDAFDELNDKEKEHFNNECELLIRLHTRQAVSDYKELVKTTNNQNPMQARNLKSNNPEQVVFEKFFADLNWFYERKEGAWKAYRSNSALWGSLKGKHLQDFRSSKTQNIKSIDNLEMSQAWLSFIGISNEAIHNKKDIFNDDKYYDLIFKRRIIKHGYDYNLSFNDASVRKEAEEQAPNAQTLLLSHLLREISDGLTPTRTQHKAAAVKRLRLEKLSTEQKDAQLVQDAGYVRGLVLAGAKYLFVDFCGLVLFRAFGSEVFRKSDRILRAGSMRGLYEDRDLSPIKTVIETDQFLEDDVIAVLWGLYNTCMEHIIEQSSWRQQFEQAAVRSRFNYSDYNRKALFNELENMDKVYQRRAIPRAWSEGIEKHKGIFNYVKASF